MPAISFRSVQVAPTPAGTPLKIGPNDSTLVRSVIIKAFLTNSDDMYIGNDGSNSVSNANGFILAPGEVLTISADEIGRGDSRYDLSTLYAVTETDGDKLSVLMLKTD